MIRKTTDGNFSFESINRFAIIDPAFVNEIGATDPADGRKIFAVENKLLHFFRIFPETNTVYASLHISKRIKSEAVKQHKRCQRQEKNPDGETYFHATQIYDFFVEYK